MKNTNLTIISQIKSVIQDCNINFLIGSGLSSPYLSLLGKTERLLTELSLKKEKEEIEKDKEKIIRASLYKKFFDDVIVKNINISRGLSDDADLNKVLNNYKKFIKLINTILLNRRSSILSRQVNLFTTNFDIFLEKSMETIGVEYNDGFSGRFNPLFNLSNFKKSFFKRSLHYDNVYELPVFNLMKIHGSLTWKKKIGEESIYFDKCLNTVKNIIKINIPDNQLIDVKAAEKNNPDNFTIGCLTTDTKKLYSSCLKIPVLTEGEKPENSDEISINQNIEKFTEEYEKLSIINPTKEKFKETILNRNHYELLRIYSTELERENTVLFVMGFSFSDEHIRELTVRVANSNPTLKIYVFAHTKKAKQNIEKNIDKSKPNNQNIQILSPDDLNNDNHSENETKEKFDFENINKKVFGKILRGIDEEEYNRQFNR